jgi:hypothetical protein
VRLAALLGALPDTPEAAGLVERDADPVLGEDDETQGLHLGG